MSVDFTLFAAYGRLTEDPKLFEMNDGSSICRFTIASNKRIGPDKEKTAFIPVLVPDSTNAENCYKYLSKGRGVYVHGTFETEKKTGKDGNVYNNFELRAKQVTFGSGGSKESEREVDEAVSKITQKMRRDSGR